MIPEEIIEGHTYYTWYKMSQVKQTNKKNLTLLTKALAYSVFYFKLLDIILIKGLNGIVAIPKDT